MNQGLENYAWPAKRFAYAENVAPQPPLPATDTEDVASGIVSWDRIENKMWIATGDGKTFYWDVDRNVWVHQPKVTHDE